MEVEGDVPEGAYLIAFKHEAMVETIEALRFARTPVVVMKRELTQIPLFGWVTRRYGVIGVDREAGAKALRNMLAEGKKAVEQKRPVIIFPEGTRVPHGQRPELRPGFAGLYRALGLPVVPVAHDSGKLWSRGIIKRPGVIRFKVGEVIPPSLKRDDVEARVRQAINALN
jgi:1-acyl-sn-glycerol-3-phosphate acyltransferase